MALHTTGLGKGLDALIRETNEARGQTEITTLRLDDIIPNAQQPRRTFSEKSLAELSESIKSQGVLQPLLVRPLGGANPDKYEIVAGERRWRASRLAGLTEVPVVVRSLSAQDTLVAALVENLQREDLNPIEEALGLQTLKEEFALSQDDLAQKIGKSRSAIANSLRLLALPEQMRPLLAEGSLSAGHARALLSIADAKAQEYLKNLILENKLSVREAEGLAAIWKETGRFELAGIVEKEEAVLAAMPEMSGEEAAREEAIAREMKPAAPKKLSQSAQLLEVQNRIAELLQMPVRVTGKEDKGKISFSYSSKEELAAFLERLCTLALDGELRAALAGRADQALDGPERPALGAEAKAAVAGRVQSAIGREDRQALRGAAPAPQIEGGKTLSLAQGEDAPARGAGEEAVAGEEGGNSGEGAL